MNDRKRLLRMLDLPAIRALEDKILIYGDRPVGAHDLADRASKKVFDITEDDTHYDPPEHYEDLPDDSPEVDGINAEWDRWEAQFETDGLSDDEQAEVLKRLGVDFTDERGQPLRCTRYLARVAEAAAKGIAGKLPDDVSQFEDKVAREAQAFLAKKRAGGR